MRNTLLMAALLGTAHITIVLAASIALVLQTQIGISSDPTRDQAAHQPAHRFLKNFDNVSRSNNYYQPSVTEEPHTNLVLRDKFNAVFDQLHV